MSEINVLWTGGWDSTYRVLELLLIENQTVRPYYIVDPERKSIANEILAMTNIRYRIKAAFPAQAERLMTLEMFHLEAIQPDKEISEWSQRLRFKTHIGTQYDWLARFAKYNATELELCTEKISRFEAELLLFRDFVRPLLRGKGHECRIEGPYPELAVQMFKYFRFPIMHLTKADMRAISEEHGFSDIMKLIWFCHSPKKGLPCGKCLPCLMAPASGLEYTFYQENVWDKINRMRNWFISHLLK